MTAAHGWYDEIKTLLMGVAMGAAIFGRGQDAPPTPQPAPPVVVPPKPDPTPPAPTPVAWGPPARAIVLYESSALTGREPIYSLTFRDAMSAAFPPLGRNPQWRIWDKDVPVRESDWVDAAAKARADYSTGVVVYAIDAAGRIKAVPIDGLSDVEAAAKVKGIAGK